MGGCGDNAHHGGIQSRRSTALNWKLLLMVGAVGVGLYAMGVNMVILEVDNIHVSGHAAEQAVTISFGNIELTVQPYLARELAFALMAEADRRNLWTPVSSN